MSTTDGQLFITALSSNEKMEVQYVPEKLGNDLTADYGVIKIVGRNNSLRHYTGGDERLSLDLDFHSEAYNREDVIKKCSWLKSISVNNGYDDPPERIRVTFGKVFQKEIWLIESVNISYEQFESVNGFLPIQAYVKLNLVLDTSRNRTRRDILWQ